MSQKNPRAVAAKMLEKVIYGGTSLSQLLTEESASDPMVRDLCFGTLRWHERLTAILDILLTKALKSKDKDVECLLRVGLYQILYQSTPEYAAVDETVAAVKKLKKPWATKFINGVLRTFLRRKESVLHQIDELETARYAFPQWLLDAVREAWPEQWESVLTQSNERAPMTLRVNLSQHTRDEYQAMLQAEAIESTPHPLVPSALILEKPMSVFELPGFNEGFVSVQDAAAQLAAFLLACEPGMRVLDACAAPGGKTGHLLEHTANIKVVAVENTEMRLLRIGENLERLGLEAEIVLADAGEPGEWTKPGFDRILLDAPCSATGVIRRHPDIKVLRWQEDIAELHAQQHKLLNTMWDLLNPGGRIVYATCSILPSENEAVVAAFCQSYPDAQVLPIVDVDWGIAQQYGRQVLPGVDAMDGFYYAVIHKQ